MAQSSFSKGCSGTFGVLFALLAVTIIVGFLVCGGSVKLFQGVESVRQEVKAKQQQQPAPTKTER